MPWDDYQKVRETFIGQFGRTYLVHRAADKKLLAMKELDMSSLDQEERQNVLRDVYVLNSLKHPYVIRYCEKFMHENQLCLVIDECDEGNLWSFVRLCSTQHAMIPEAQVVRWFTQACLGVKYLHDRAHPILHGDIKTQNIYLVKKESSGLGNAKLFVDFGPMKVLDSADSLVRGSVGTHFCQSPEIVHRTPFGLASDMWALGCVLYELCAAYMSWDATDMADHIENITMVTLSPISGKYSAQIEGIMGSLLAFEATDRPSAAVILKTTYLQAEMRRMLEDRNKTGAKGTKGHQEEVRHDKPTGVRPLGEHNPRRPHTARSPSPNEAAKLLLKPGAAKAERRETAGQQEEASSPPKALGECQYVRGLREHRPKADPTVATREANSRLRDEAAEYLLGEDAPKARSRVASQKATPRQDASEYFSNFGQEALPPSARATSRRSTPREEAADSASRMASPHQEVEEYLLRENAPRMPPRASSKLAPHEEGYQNAYTPRTQHRSSSRRATPREEATEQRPPRAASRAASPHHRVAESVLTSSTPRQLPAACGTSLYEEAAESLLNNEFRRPETRVASRKAGLREDSPDPLFKENVPASERLCEDAAAFLLRRNRNEQRSSSRGPRPRGEAA
eukprot:TRINITY_DN91440_c0_g1_i1.p1 TRINITY_DN91440_c0_g1~~TRINITY_DN91440_c0_g1_i1.p1  ORF type:complete len:627 (+),score=110.40 TRINITY_DN91440_c0_g1_i1:50-1930(+)